MGLSVGEVLDGKYRILRHIGAGGMGNVYEGENMRIQRRIAIKELKADVAEHAEFCRRFEREAQAAARIGSEHIVEVLDMGELPDCLYLVMEYLEGESLSDRMAREGAMAPEVFFPLVVQVLDGLAAAHDAGILHRDLKPANIFLVSDRREPDFVKILDFGVSKFMDVSAEDATNTGVMLGTPRYMSPEQAKGDKDIDARADLYSVGVIMYRGLTGTTPYEADNYNELLFKVVLEDPPPVTEVAPDVDPSAAALVEKAMARDREARFESAEQMASALRGWLDERGIAVPTPPPRREAIFSGDTPMPRSTKRLRGPMSPPSGSTKLSSVVVADAVTPKARRRTGVWMLSIGITLATALTVVFVARIGFDSPPEPATPEPVTIVPSAPPPTTTTVETVTVEEFTTETTTVAPEASASSEATPEATPEASATSTAGPVAAPPLRPPPVRPSGPRRKYRKEL